MGRIMPQTIPPDNIKSDWLARLSKLIDQIELWARQNVSYHAKISRSTLPLTSVRR
jgi:hypothetical protein